MKKILLSLSCVAFLYASQAAEVNYEAEMQALAAKVPDFKDVAGDIDQLFNAIDKRCGELCGQGDQRPRTLKRVFSQQEIGPGGTVQTNTFTFEEYCSLAEQFFVNNGIGDGREIIGELGQAKAKSEEALTRLEAEYDSDVRDFNGFPVNVIDISWPNIRRRFIEKGEGTPRARLLKMIICLTANHNQDKPLEEYLKNIIVKLCTEGDDSLFRFKNKYLYPKKGAPEKLKLIKLDRGQKLEFIRKLKLQLDNFSFFQRIMATLVVEKEGGKGFNILTCDSQWGQWAWYVDACRGIVTRSTYWSNTSDDEKEGAFHHELTHGFHAIVTGDRDTAWYNAFLSAFAALNFGNDDLIDSCFPVFIKSRMDPIVGQIKDAIDDAKFETMKSKLASGEGGTEVKEMFKRIIKYGLGSLVFNKGALNFKLNEMLTKEIFAKALYVDSAFILKTGEREQTRWLSGEEMITMIGMVPVVKGEETYIIEDRQNGEIFNMRQEENRSGIPFNVPIYGNRSGYAYHDPAYPAERLKAFSFILKDSHSLSAETRAGSGEEDVKADPRSADCDDSQADQMSAAIVGAGRDGPERRKFAGGDDVWGIDYEKIDWYRVLDTLKKAVTSRDKLVIRAIVERFIDGEGRKRPGYRWDVELRVENILISAVRQHDVDKIKILFEGGGDKLTDVKGGELLRWTVWLGGEKEVEEVLNHCASSVNEKECGTGDTPLHIAARRENKEIAEMLLKHGADKTAENSWGEKPFDLVSEYNVELRALLSDAAGAAG